MDRGSARDVTEADIKELITERQREENALEFKSTNDIDLYKAACAIANFGGGFIVLGVTEDRRHCAAGIKNIPNSERVADSVRQALRDGISPRPVFEVAVLAVGEDEVIVIRIAPQNPPHMISSEQRSDFYGRYDATSTRMRYEEIEEAFRRKHALSEAIYPTTPTVTIESTSGRTSISEGTEGFLSNTIADLVNSGGSLFAIVAASDQMQGEVTAEIVRHAFEQPLYYRRNGWNVANPGTELVFRNAGWEQVIPNRIRVTSSGDILFVASADGPLCSHQPDELYPYAITEYCVSFSYLLADIVASSQPLKVLVQPVVASRGRRIRLPVGEPQSIWFEQQRSSANAIQGDCKGIPIVESFDRARPVLSRELALKIASQVYECFSYGPDKVPYSYHGELTVESEAITATLTSVRTYVRDMLLTEIEMPHRDVLRQTFSMGYSLNSERRIFWVSELFLMTHHWEERRLFELLDSFDLIDRLRKAKKNDNVFLGADGVGALP